VTKFIFRLERLLRLRSQEENVRARELGDAMQKEEAARQTSEEAEARLERCRGQAAPPVEVVSAAGTLRNLNLAVYLAAQQARSASDDHEATVDDVATKQEEFGAARKDRRVIERLRENRKQSWSVEAAREEQKELDGIALQRWQCRGES
jgi:flagellar export protein FliJ